MATNLALDDELLKAAQLLGHHTTKKEAVTTALREYIQGLRLKEFLALAGTIDYYREDFSQTEFRKRASKRMPPCE